MKKNQTDKEKIPCAFCVDRSDFKPLSKKYIAEIKPRLQEYYRQVFDSLGFNGSFLVARNGTVLFEGYSGFADKEKGTKISSKTPLHIASVGKVLTATAIFRLIETKKLKLDQSLKSIFPKFPYPEVTLRMMLNHRSGIPKYANFIEPDSIWGVEKTLHNKDILNLIIKHKIPLDFVPETKFVYNNSNYALLGLVIEKVTKKPFKTAMNDLVFEPLGMRNTFVFMLEKDSNKVSQSYNTQFDLQDFDNLDAIFGDKNIYSTPRDLLKFDLAMQKNDFISKKLKREIYRGYSYERAGINNYGLGIRLKEWDTGQKIFFHNGWWHGNRAAYVTLKKENVMIIAMTNANTRKVYDVIRLSSLFGDYPFDVSEEEEEEENTPTVNLETIQMVGDSIVD